MRFAFAIFALSAAGAFAADPTPVPAAGSAAMPGVYKAYTPPPTAVPTPAPVQGISAAHYSIHKDTMGVAIRGGGALPLGDLAKNNLAGFSTAFDLVYGASDLVDVAFDLSYASMPYKLTTTTQSLSSMGIGVKAILKTMHDQKLGINIEGGMGYYSINRVVALDKGPDPANPNLRLTEPASRSAGGIGFLLGAAIHYQFTPHFAAAVQADAVQVSLSGGTGDTPLFLTPSLSISYTF